MLEPTAYQKKIALRLEREATKRSLLSEAELKRLDLQWYKLKQGQDKLAQGEKALRAELAASLLKTRKRLKAAHCKALLIEQRINALKDKYSMLERLQAPYLDGTFAEYPAVPRAPIYSLTNVEALPPVTGIYFLWLYGVVDYVGQSINIPQRLKTHARRLEDHQVTFLEVDRNFLNWAEAYYIGVLRPLANFGGPPNKRLCARRNAENGEHV